MVVEQVYEALRKLSDRQGFVSAEPEDLVRAVKEKVEQPRDRGSDQDSRAEQGGRVEQRRTGPRHVRLLATPERIKRELTGVANTELGLLRALWRGVGPSLKTGAVVDLDGLPPGLGGAVRSVPLLESLQDRQFLTWERLGAGLYLADRNAPITKYSI